MAAAVRKIIKIAMMNKPPPSKPKDEDPTLAAASAMTTPPSSTEGERKRPHSEVQQTSARGSKERRMLREDESDSEDEDGSVSNRGQNEDGKETDTLSLLRRQKRLAMNRESARARRRRKKILIETLEEQVTDLTSSNERFKQENQQLVVRIERLSAKVAEQEKELLLLRSAVGKGTGMDPRLALQQQQQQQQQQHQQLAAGASHPYGSDPFASSGMFRSPLEGQQQQQHFNSRLDPASAAADISLRRLLQAQSLERAAAQRAVPPNRGIDQQILSRIEGGGGGGGGSGFHYDSSPYDFSRYGSPRSYSAAVAGGALPGHNSINVPPSQMRGPASQFQNPFLSQAQLSAGSESSRGILGFSSMASPNDPTTALLLEQLMQKERRRQQG